MEREQPVTGTTRRQVAGMASVALGGFAAAYLSMTKAVAAPPTAGQTVRDRLVGSWQMIDWKILKGETSLPPPLGPADQCGGLLIYSPEGTVSAFLSAKSRPRFKDASLDGGTAEEKLHAFDTVIAYTGRYDVDESTATVQHHVLYASLPNFVGQTLPRVCIFERDTLKLDTPPMKFGGESLASYILWRRMA